MKTTTRFLFTTLLSLTLLASIGCDSADTGAEEDLSVDGLWQAQADASVYLSVASSVVSSYEFLPNGTVNNNVACYFVQPFTVVRLEGNTYTLRDNVLDFEFVVTMTRRDDVLTTVMTVDGSPNTVRYNRASGSVGALSPDCATTGRATR